MRILLIGSGGREHALAWKILQSSRVDHLWIAPGNGGTAALGEQATNVPIAAEDIDGLANFAQSQGIDLTVIGPEAPLAMGIADAFAARGLGVFGPNRAAAQLEASKAFAKDFMQRYAIPTARFATFTDYDAAIHHLRQVNYPVVIKASGLAAGKGVIVPESPADAEQALRSMMVERVFGEAGASVVIEERLNGPEVSLLAFSDGKTVAPMPPAQDHKRVFDGDRGPNTGGMGAFAPSPLAPPALISDLTRTILQPVIDGMRSEGTPFVGVLYAGLMLTADGPKVLEFNCRFGDPETQVILPLLDGDLVAILEACTSGRLAEVSIRWRDAAAATVVLASGGYPGPYEKGKVIHGLDAVQSLSNVIVFHAGTALRDNMVVTAGGRVLNVTAVGPSLQDALAQAYAAVDKIYFEGMHFRRDIGRRSIVDAARLF